MSNPFEVPRDPKELARVLAMQIPSNRFEHTEADERMLAKLDRDATELGFIGQSYLVDTSKALILPASWSKDKPVVYTDIPGISFEATLSSFGRVSIGRVAKDRPVRALCLVFDSALLLPYFDYTNESDVVYAPVLAVNTIDPTR
jgi:hypothetical protein